MAFGIIPLAYFWYETDEEDGLASRVCTTVCWSCVFMTIFICVLLGLFYSIGYVELPVEIIFPPGYNSTVTGQNYLKKWNAAKPPVPLWSSLTDPTIAPRVKAIQNIQTSLVIYILALLSFIGWFLLSLFAGMGLIAIPMDLISAWWNRPMPIDLKKFAEKKLELKKRCNDLLTIGREQKEAFRKKKNRYKERRFTNKYKKMVMDLEDEIQVRQDNVYSRFTPPYDALVQLVNMCYKKNELNPLLPWINLIGGIFSTVLSFSWFLQIFLQIFLQGKMAFLNVIFSALTAAFPLFGVCAYGVFAFYIMITVISGSIKFAGRFFLISIHPMKLNGTMMNSFLFNVGILLVCSVSSIQLCTTAFSQFANSSAIAQIFVVQVQYLKGLNYFYSLNVPVFYCILYIVSFGFLLYSLVCCVCCAKRQAESVEEAVTQLRREMRE